MALLLLWTTCRVGARRYWAVITANFCQTTESQSLEISVHNSVFLWKLRREELHRVL